MHMKNNFYRLLFAFLSITTLSFGGFMGNPMMPGGAMQAPSMEDIKAMEAEIDKFVQSLPPEQQKQFYKDVEELTGIMEKMSPDELNEFVGSVFSDAGLVEQAPKPMPQPTPAPKEEPTAPKETKPAVVITTAPSGPTEKALKMINGIIDRTEEFMLKAQIIPELPGKMDKWVVQKKLTEVSTKLDWESLEKQIDEFKLLLYSLLEKDPKTGIYKHIGNLIKDEALYNNLATLQVTLDAYVPLVYAPDFGLDKVSKESRAAIRQVVSQYIEAFYLLNIPAAIKKLAQIYDPRAKELSEEEKKAIEQARKEAERTRRAAPGEKTPGTQPSYASSPYDYIDNYYGGDYSYPSSYSPAIPSPEYAPLSDTQLLEMSGKGSTGSSKAPGKKEGKEGKEEKESKESKEGKEGEKAATTKKIEEVKKDDTANRKMDRIITKIEDITEPFKLFGSVLTKFKDHFDNNDFDDAFIEDKLKDLVTSIEMINIQLKKATNDIKAFKKSLKDLNKTTQNHYKKELSKALKTKGNDIVSFYKTLMMQIKEMKSLMDLPVYKSKFNENKRYVFFNEGNPTGKVKEKVPAVPVTMDQLATTIEAFLKEVE